MSLLSEFLAARLAQLGRQQKEVALTFIEAHRERVGDGRAFKGGLNTLAPKLSLLLSGDVEGENFFFREEERVAALAVALEVPLEELRGMYEKSQRVEYLILDPALPEKCRQWLERRSRELDGVVRCIDIAPGGDWRTALREAAKAHQPKSIVVLVDEEAHRAFFEGADIRTTGLRYDPLGFVLTRFENLVPLDPAPGPLLWDPEDQAPLVPYPEVEQMARWERESESPHDRPRFAYKGGPASLRVPAWLTRREQRWEKHAWRNEPPMEALLDAALGSALPTTLVWLWDGRLWSLGPPTTTLDELRKHHAVLAPTQAMARLKRVLAELNPWAPHAPEWKALQAELLELGGFDLSPLLASPRFPVRIGAAHERQAWRPKGLERAQAMRLVGSERAVAPIRALLEDLVDRATIVDDASGYGERRPYWAAFSMELLARAPMRRIEQEGPAAYEALVNLGAGHVAHLEVYLFKAHAPGDLRVGPAGVMDGHDVRLYIQADTEPLLEGTVLPGRKRRREDEARRKDEEEERLQAALDDD